jgi:hypothetical protein
VYPPPKKIDDFLGLDDNAAWSRIVAAKKDACRAVLSRRHIRAVYETPELPKPDVSAALMSAKNKLEKAGVWYYEDAIDKAWYRTAERTGVEGEIMVVPRKTGLADPLSQYSEVVKYIGGTNMSRLYVKEADRKKAEEVLT